MLAEHVSTRGNRNISEEQCPFMGGKVCLFGSGPRAVNTRDWLRDRGVEVAVYLDNDIWRQDELLDGVPILAPNKVVGQGGLPVIVCCAVEHKISIGQQLAMLGVEDVYFLEDAKLDRRPPRASMMQWDRLETFCADLADEDSRLALAGVVRALELGRGGYVRMSPYLQYKHPVVKACPGDVVFSAGGFDGTTALAMTRATGFACTVHCFEPQSDLFGRMRANARHIPAASFVPVNKGLHSESTTLLFSEDGYANGSARVAEDGEVAIEVVSVDDYAQESGVERVDMISLDVEGSELEVLRGARESIERFAPKLQLSLYHQLSHLWEVYETVKAMRGDYRFYVGHHTQHFNETMLYAIRAE